MTIVKTLALTLLILSSGTSAKCGQSAWALGWQTELCYKWHQHFVLNELIRANVELNEGMKGNFKGKLCEDVYESVAEDGLSSTSYMSVSGTRVRIRWHVVTLLNVQQTFADLVAFRRMVQHMAEHRHRLFLGEQSPMILFPDGNSLADSFAH